MKLNVTKVAKTLSKIGNKLLRRTITYMNIGDIVEMRKRAEAVVAICKVRENQARDAILGKEETIDEQE